jgi:hypothetical protein
MRPVSEKQKERFGKYCLICFKPANQHHPLIYSGRQIDEISVPLCKYHHQGNNGDIFQEVKELTEYIAINSNLEYLKINYPKYDWQQRFIYLKRKSKINSKNL